MLNLWVITRIAFFFFRRKWKLHSDFLRKVVGWTYSAVSFLIWQMPEKIREGRKQTRLLQGSCLSRGPDAHFVAPLSRAACCALFIVMRGNVRKAIPHQKKKKKTAFLGRGKMT